VSRAYRVSQKRFYQMPVVQSGRAQRVFKIGLAPSQLLQLWTCIEHWGITPILFEELNIENKLFLLISLWIKKTTYKWTLRILVKTLTLIVEKVLISSVRFCTWCYRHAVYLRTMLRWTWCMMYRVYIHEGHI